MFAYVRPCPLFCSKSAARPLVNVEMPNYIADALDRPQGELDESSRQGARSRSMQSRMAVGSSASASSTALRVKASDSPASQAATASVALFREPVLRPAGACPHHHQCLASCPALFIRFHQTKTRDCAGDFARFSLAESGFFVS